LLYGLLGGGHPTEGEHTTPLAQMQVVTGEVPKPLSDAVLRADSPGAEAQAWLLRGDLDTIVARALKKNPAERYANAAALSPQRIAALVEESAAAAESLKVRARPLVEAAAVFKLSRRELMNEYASWTRIESCDLGHPGLPEC
jgi:hypothetical protein